MKSEKPCRHCNKQIDFVYDSYYNSGDEYIHTECDRKQTADALEIVRLLEEMPEKCKLNKSFMGYLVKDSCLVISYDKDLLKCLRKASEMGWSNDEY